MRAALAVTVLTLPACGHGGAGTSSNTVPSPPLATDPPSYEALTAVNDAVSRAMGTSAQVSLAMSGAQALGGDASGTGTMNFASGTGSLTLTLGGRAGTEQVLVDGDGFYVRSAAAAAGGKPWILVSNADATSVSGPDRRLVVQALSVSPAFVLTELAWGAEICSAAGKTTVNGQTVDRYVATLSFYKATDTETGPLAKVYDIAIATQIADHPTASGGNEIPVEVDVDSAGNLVRVVITPPTGDVGTDAFTFQTYGAAVSVTPPSPQDTTDIAAVGSGGETEKKPGADGDKS